MSVENKKLEENRKTVVGFFQKALFEGDVDMAIRLYGGKTYTQHTPFAADGFDGLRNYVKWIAKNYRNTRGEIKRVLQTETMSFFTVTTKASLERTVTPSSIFSGWRTVRSSNTGMSSSLNENTMF
jgi:predicted SnoaL-like aldol condensation-catalyzing enzyme